MRHRALASFLVLASLTAGCLGSGPIADRFTGPGDAAKDLVGAKYPKLVVELDHPADDRPTQAAIDTLRATLREVTARSNVEIALSASIPGAPSKKYTIDELRSLEKEHRDRHTGGDTAVLYVLYVSGGSSDDSDEGNVLGVTYGGTSIAIFRGNLESSVEASRRPTLGLGGVRLEEVERAVLVHEFGHAAGLVNLGAPMTKAREDASHKGHSTNEESVMFWAVESSAGLLSLLTGDSSIPYQFDADDKADLKALRES